MCPVEIEVDGGIDAKTAPAVAAPARDSRRRIGRVRSAGSGRGNGGDPNRGRRGSGMKFRLEALLETDPISTIDCSAIGCGARRMPSRQLVIAHPAAGRRSIRKCSR